MSADQQQQQPPTSPPPSNSSSPATPTGGGAAKRNLFGRKKKSVTNLGPSPSGSSNNLVSAGSSLRSGQSVESLQDRATAAGAAGSEGPGGKGLRSVFKRKGGKSIGDIEEDRETEAADDIEDGIEGGERRGGASEDDGVLSYDSEPDVAPHRPSTAGALSPNTQSPESTPGKLMHSATFSPYDSTGKLAEFAPKKTAVVDILISPFRRSTSPNTADTNMPSLPRANTNLPTATPDIRPATSGGESRRSGDRGRRTGRTSVGTSDGSELPLDTAQARTWPGGIITKDYAQPGALLDPHNPDTTVQTTVTPPTPTDTPVHFPPNPKSPVGAVVNKTGQKRSRTNSLSGTPSKLSQIMTAPLAPTAEAGGFAAGAGSPGMGAGGFFQTMFSAAQTAATSFSNTIANTNISNNGTGTGSRPRTASGQSDRDIDKENIPAAEPQRRLAVETLGHGELSLGSLGILPSPKRTVSEGSGGGRGGPEGVGAADGGGYDGDPFSAGGVANTPISAVSNSDTFETAVNSPVYGGDPRLIRTPVAEDSAFLNGGRKDSLSGAATPERSSILATNEIDDTWFGDNDRRRSGSMKSGVGARRKRGSSAASGSPALQPVPRPTGFAVASKKRNRDFHALFRSVPEDDYLIEDYGCALQKDILLQGRFYVSEGHICFNSNIFGWVNTQVISFDEVVSVEKKSTVMVFPNAIVIQTLHARHVFASFISRDSTYDLIVGIWKISHPSLISGSTGVRLDSTDSAVGESASILGGSEYEEDADSGSDEYEDGSDDASYTDAGDGFMEGAGATSKSLPRKASVQPLAALADGTTRTEFPGPATHPPTYCMDAPEHTHYDRQLCDEVIAAPLGQAYSLVFGPASYPFISRFLAEEEKVLDIVIPDRGEWKDVDGKKVRSFSYIKPLGGPIGPKQTKCLITETIDVCELDNYVSVVVATQTPDVPSGNVFVVKSRYCLMWAGDGATRLVASCTVEWSGKSWLKGPIEKGANDGQVAYNANLVTALKRECLPKEPVSRSSKKMSKKKRKALEAKGQVLGRSAVGTIKGREMNASINTTQTENWGILSPLKPYLGPIIDILQPLLNGNLGVLVICVLIVMLVIRGRSGSATTEVGRGGPGVGVRGWEQAWQAEEEGLWEWLEDRSGLGGIGELGREKRMRGFEKVLGGRRRVGEGMKGREMEEAIGIMEERLEVLRRVVEGRKGRKEEV